jgi:transcriptional regulator with XRE-family HTH domain
MTRNRKIKANATGLSGLKIEMAKPRSTASVSQGTPKRLGGATPLSPAGVDEIPPTPGTIISAFTGVYERIARKLNVSASLVSKVASGSRKSVDIDAELAAELKTLKEKLARYD